MKSALNIAVAALAITAAAQAATIQGIGTAANYTLLQYNNAWVNSAGVPITCATGCANDTMQISGASTTINGVIGISQGGQANFASSSPIGTNSLQMYSTDPTTNTGTLTPSQSTAVNSALTQAVQDAVAAFNNNIGVTPNTTINTVVDGTTAGGKVASFASSGTGAINVIRLTQGINMTTGGLNLNISGDSTSKFVFIVDTQFTMNAGDATTLSGGIGAEDILWLYTASTSLSMTGGSVGTNVFDGTVIAENAAMSIHDHTFNGAFISGKGIAITSNGQFNGADFALTTPEPASYSMAFGGFLALGFGVWRRRRNRKAE